MARRKKDKLFVGQRLFQHDLLTDTFMVVAITRLTDSAAFVDVGGRVYRLDRSELELHGLCRSDGQEWMSEHGANIAIDHAPRA